VGKEENSHVNSKYWGIMYGVKLPQEAITLHARRIVL